MNYVIAIAAFLASMVAFAQDISFRAPSIDTREELQTVERLSGIPSTVARLVANDFKRYSPINKCWLREIDGRDQCYKVALYAERGEPGSYRSYLVLSAAPLNERGIREAGCQACDGYVSVYVIDGDNWKVASKGIDIKAGVAGAGANAWEIAKFGDTYAFATKSHEHADYESTEGLSRCSQGACVEPFYTIAEVDGLLKLVIDDISRLENGFGMFKCNPPQEERRFYFLDEQIGGYPVVRVVDNARKDCQKFSKLTKDARIRFDPKIKMYPRQPLPKD